MIVVVPGKSPQSSVRLQFEKVLVSIVLSPLRTAIAVFLFGVSTLLLEYIVHLAVTRLRLPAQVQAFADSLILGILAAIFALIVLTAARTRHHKIRDDLKRIAELNHQVRNALQIIVYGEYSPSAVEHRQAVLAGVEKIEAALRELFPLVGERTDDRPWETHNRARMAAHNPLKVHLPERRRG
jgi:branched-subunit amino acid transport protein